MNNISANPVASGKLRTVLKSGARLLVILLLLTLVGVVAASFLLPRRYYSRVIMGMTSPDSGVIDVYGPPPPPYDTQYVPTQLAVMQKTEFLYPVIQRLDLTKAYAPPGKTISIPDAYQRLRASMRLQEVRPTGMVEIGISDTDAQRAADIANAIATTYQVTLGTTTEEVMEVQRQLEEDIATQSKKVEEASRLAAELRRLAGIIDDGPISESTMRVTVYDPAFPNDGSKSVTLTVPANNPAVPNDDGSVPNPAEADAAGKKMMAYVKAKRQADREQKVLESMELGLGGQPERTDLLKRWRIKIWEKAVKAGHPENRIASLVDHILH